MLDFSLIDNRDNLVFIGPPGVGKTHLAIGIGHKAVQAGYKVLFRTALALIEDLEPAEMKGELKKRLNQLSKYDVLIIDRVIHHSHIFMLGGESYRLKQKTGG